MSDEFAKTSEYFQRYKESADLAITQMKTLLNSISSKPPSSAPKTDATSVIDAQVTASTAAGPPADALSGASASVQSNSNSQRMEGHTSATTPTVSLSLPRMTAMLNETGMTFSADDVTSRPWGNFSYTGANSEQRERSNFSRGGIRIGAPDAPFSSRAEGARAEGARQRSTEASWSPHPTQDIANGLGIQNMQVGGNALLGTLGSTAFNINNFIPTKFSGNPSRFPEFLLRLEMADKAMASIGFNHSQRFLHLLKCLDSTPLEYVKNLPLTAMESYSRAISCLKELYLSSYNDLKNAIIKFYKIPRCNPSFASRQAWHSAAASFFNTVATKNFTWEQNFIGMCIMHLEATMDEGLKRQWLKICARRRDTSQPLGYPVDLTSFMDQIYQIMLTDLSLSHSSSSAHSHPNQRVRFRNGVHAVTSSYPEGDDRQAGEERSTLTRVDERSYATVAGTPVNRSKNRADQRRRQTPPPPPLKRGNGPLVATAGANKQTGQPYKVEIKSRCWLCWSPRTKTQLPHSWPLRCPRLRKEPRITAEELRRIAKAHKLCFNCFSPNHNPCTAPPESKCRHCGKRHHSILCNNKA